MIKNELCNYNVNTNLGQCYELDCNNETMKRDV